MKFKVHGKASIKIEGRLMHIDVEGPWNVELVEEILVRIAEHSATLSGSGKWAMAIAVGNSFLCPPDAIEAIRRSALKESSDANRAAIAFVVPDSVEGRGLVDRYYYEIYNDIRPIGFFGSLDEARTWISPYLA